MYSVLLFLAIVCQLVSANEKTGLQCLFGGEPKPQKKLSACQRFSSLACCKPLVTKSIASNSQKMGNFSWNLCGRLSPQCHKYFRRMECFYQCSPFVNQWKHPMRHSGISRAPICAPFCDSFYEACKDDLTCVKDWLNGFVMEKGWKNECPKDSTCKKFSEVYRNGDDMCSTMWGDSLQYTKTKNCLEVDFEGTNPNWRVHKTTEKGTFKKNNNYFSKVLALLGLEK